MRQNLPKTLTVPFCAQYNERRCAAIQRKWGLPVKPIVCLLLCLLLCCPAAALAEEPVIYTEIEPHLVRYSFDLPQYSFVYVKFDTQNDAGSKVLYSGNGHFEGVCEAPGTFEEARLGLNVYTLGNRLLMQTKLTLEADASEQSPAAGLPAVAAANKVTDLALTYSPEGLHYRFSAPGRDSVILRCKSPQEWHRITLYADAGYRYEGVVPLPCTYPDDTVTVSILTPNSAPLYESSVLIPYHAPEAPQTLKSTELMGVVVCIDAGHQRTTQVETVQSGPNFVQTTTTTIGMAKGTETRRMESQVTLEIAMQLRNALLERGASVLMTREIQDTFVGMLDRSAIPNNAKADFVLRLHCNSRRSNPDVQGIEVYCPLSSSYAKQVADTDGYRLLGETLLRAMQKATGMPKGGCTLNDTYVGNNWSKMPSFLVEMGYMTNFEEDLLLSSPEYQQRLAQGMTQGIIEMARLRGLID